MVSGVVHWHPVPLYLREGRWSISPKPGNPHQNNPDGQKAVQVRGKICIFDFGVNCPFKGFSTLEKMTLQTLNYRNYEVNPHEN